VKKEQNGRKSLRRLKPTVGCKASRRRRRKRRRRLNDRTKNSKNMVVQAVRLPLEPGTVSSCPVAVNVCGIH
jgi:hypothetical protein